MFYYSLTIVKNETPKFYSDYLKYIEWIKLKLHKFGITIEPHFEKGEDVGLHVHCLVILEREVKSCYGFQKAGWHIGDYRPIDSLSAWETYIRKAQALEPSLIRMERQIEFDFHNPQF